MINEIERLPRMIERAASALAKATTAAEILDVQRDANAVYSAAKIAARFAKIKGAHDTVMAACHRAQADALMIAARAQIRLADEYDAAQERGEVATTGKPVNIPNGNNKATLPDLGISAKQVHEARLVRDAERRKPGVIQKTLSKKLELGEEPTRADVKRAIKPKPPIKPVETADAKGRVAGIDVKTKPEVWNAFRQKAHDENLSPTEKVAAMIEADVDPEINVSSLPLTSQQKVDAAIRQHRRKLEQEFERIVQERLKQILDDGGVLDQYQKEISNARQVVAARKGAMNLETFNLIRRCLHPDNSASDETRSRAFTAFEKMKLVLIKEDEFSTSLPPMPRTYEELMKARAATSAKRKHQQQKSSNAVRR